MPDTNPKELQPPMQNEPGFFILDYANPSATPHYRFAVAAMKSDDIVEVNISCPGPAPAKEGEEALVENVTQTYSVMVPYTELVDGKQLTKMRCETRVRTVPVRKVRPVSDVDNPDDQIVKETYAVHVPYTERTKDGIIQRTRKETRTRTVRIHNFSIDFVPHFTSNSHSIDDVQCFLPTGEPISSREAAERLTKPLPVLVVNSEVHICDYFGELLKPNCLIMVQPESKHQPH